MEGYHHATQAYVVSELKTDLQHGLSSREARQRLARYGANDLVVERPVSKFVLLARQLQSPLVYILLIAAAFAAFKSDWPDVTIILLVVVVNALIGFFQENKAERTMAKLRTILSPKARVIRDRIEQKISAKLLVPGDIIRLEAGDRVPADARVIEAQNLRLNQASLTGESIPSMKKPGMVGEKTALIDRTNMVYLSTLVVNGQGYAVVTSTGMRTELGTITASVAAVKESTEGLTRKIISLSRYLVVVAIALSTITLLVGYFKGVESTELIKTVISLLVSVVPEGLPIAVTVTLSVGLLRVFKKHGVIRKLSAAETLGSVTTICVDKTGTITEGKMRADRVMVAGVEYTVTGSGYELSGEFHRQDKPVSVAHQPALKLIAELSALSTTSTISKEDLARDEARELSDPTETALAVLGAKAGYYAFRREQEYPEILEIPFDQENRYSVSVHQWGKKYRYIVKGAPERILALSKKMVNSLGVEKPLLTQSRSVLLKAINAQAELGYRLTAMAYIDYPHQQQPSIDYVQNLVFVGLISLADPVRQDVKAAIEEARLAGLKVVMITGDHALTARSIAQEAGLLENGTVMNADEVTQADISKLSVIARATPSQKLSIVSWLQENGEIVAMTGDGVNDAPALKKSDIGIAMGRGGTDVAIEASDMVLLKDEFSSITAAVEQGRLIWENLRKVVTYLVSTGAAELSLILMAIILDLPLALSAVQILWINLATDGVTSLALTVEPKERNLMRQKPRLPSEQLVSIQTATRIVLTSLTMMLVSLFVYQSALPSGVEYARTVAMTTMIFFQLFHLLNCRSRTQSIFKQPFFNNAVLVSTVALAILLTVLAVYTPLMQQLLQTVSLPTSVFLTSAFAGSTVIIVDEVRKIFARRLNNA